MDYKVAMTDESNILAEVVDTMRDADKAFETVCGSTRHYLRDVFLPLLHKKGISLCKVVKNEEAQQVLVTVFADEDTSKVMLAPVEVKDGVS